MPILKDGRLVFDEDAKLIDWQTWQKQTAANALSQNEKIGIIFPNDQDPMALEKHIARLAIIALHFPTFRDGRAYSQARLLREHLGFNGELRATGDVLIDQAFFMLRCGFNSFALPEAADHAAWQKAFEDFSLFYQPTQTDKQKTIWEQRHPAPKN